MCMPSIHYCDRTSILTILTNRLISKHDLGKKLGGRKDQKTIQKFKSIFIFLILVNGHRNALQSGCLHIVVGYHTNPAMLQLNMTVPVFKYLFGNLKRRSSLFKRYPIHR